MPTFQMYTNQECTLTKNLLFFISFLKNTLQANVLVSIAIAAQIDTLSNPPSAELTLPC